MAERSYTGNGKISGIQYPKFLGIDQNNQGKSVSPYNQPRLSHNTAYTNSTKDLNSKKT